MVALVTTFCQLIKDLPTDRGPFLLFPLFEEATWYGPANVAETFFALLHFSFSTHWSLASQNPAFSVMIYFPTQIQRNMGMACSGVLPMQWCHPVALKPHSQAKIFHQICQNISSESI